MCSVINILKVLRGEKTQAEMAKKYKVSQQAWSNWENGAKLPRPWQMKKIAKDFGRTIDEIFFANKNNLL